jgi:hypothetical protein
MKKLFLILVLALTSVSLMAANLVTYEKLAAPAQKVFVADVTKARVAADEKAFIATLSAAYTRAGVAFDKGRALEFYRANAGDFSKMSQKVFLEDFGKSLGLADGWYGLSVR